MSLFVLKCSLPIHLALIATKGKHNGRLVIHSFVLGIRSLLDPAKGVFQGFDRKGILALSAFERLPCSQWLSSHQML